MNPSTQLSIDAKDHVIIFNDFSRKFITKRQYEKILEVSGESKFIIDGCEYYKRKIDKLLTPEEFASQYPKETKTIYRDFSAEKPFKWERQNKRGLEEMAKGVQRHIDSDKYQGGREPIDLLAKMKLKLVDF